jgi:hypothetical protein
VVRAENPHLVAEGALVQRNCFIGSPCLPVGIGEVVPGADFDCQRIPTDHDHPSGNSRHHMAKDRAPITAVPSAPARWSQGPNPKNQGESADSRSKRRSSSDLSRQQDRSPPPGGSRQLDCGIVRRYSRSAVGRARPDRPGRRPDNRPGQAASTPADPRSPAVGPPTEPHRLRRRPARAPSWRRPRRTEPRSPHRDRPGASRDNEVIAWEDPA